MRRAQERGGGGDDEGNASKKPRVTWSVEMHQKFVAAVNQLGVDSEWCWVLEGRQGRRPGACVAAVTE